MDGAAASDTGVLVVVGIVVGTGVGDGSGNGVAVGCGVDVAKGVDVDACVGVGVGEGSAGEEQAARSMRDRAMDRAVMDVCIGISYNGNGSMSSCEWNNPGNGLGEHPTGSLRAVRKGKWARH